MSTIYGTKQVLAALNSLTGQARGISRSAAELNNVAETAKGGIAFRLGQPTPETLSEDNLTALLAQANAKIGDLESGVAAIKASLAGVDFSALANTPEPEPEA